MESQEGTIYRSFDIISHRFISALSSGDVSATTFCIGMAPYDFADKLITVTKTGMMFTLQMEGLENTENIFCESHHLKTYCITCDITKLPLKLGN